MHPGIPSNSYEKTKKFLGHLKSCKLTLKTYISQMRLQTLLTLMQLLLILFGKILYWHLALKNIYYLLFLLLVRQMLAIYNALSKLFSVYGSKQIRILSFGFLITTIGLTYSVSSITRPATLSLHILSNSSLRLSIIRSSILRHIITVS